jgi:hypothetical protein
VANIVLLTVLGMLLWRAHDMTPVTFLTPLTTVSPPS